MTSQDVTSPNVTSEDSSGSDSESSGDECRPFFEEHVIISDGYLPDFEEDYEVKAILDRVNSGNYSKKMRKVSNTDLGCFMTAMANQCLKTTLMNGKVPPTVQRKVIRAFMGRYPQILRNHPPFRHRLTEDIFKRCVKKLSRKLTRKRSRTSGPAASVEAKKRAQFAKTCRPGERADRVTPVKYEFTPEEEKMRLELVERFGDQEFDSKGTDSLWKKTLRYRRAVVGSAKWTKDPDNPGTIMRTGIKEILEQWPHLRVFRYLCYDFDYVTQCVDSGSFVVDNYRRFLRLSLLYFSTTKSGVLKHRSNAKTLKKEDRIVFDMPLGRIMAVVGELYKPGSEAYMSTTDEGRMLRLIPAYAMFERFNLWPVIRSSLGGNSAASSRGLMIQETITGRQVCGHDVATYKLFADGMELSVDNEFGAVVIAAMMAAYTLNMPLPGQVLKSVADRGVFPRAYQALLKAVFQNPDGTGAFPEEFELETTLSAQVRSILDSIYSCEAVVGVKVVDRDEGNGGSSKSTPSSSKHSGGKAKHSRSQKSISKTPVDGTPKAVVKSESSSQKTPATFFVGSDPDDADLDDPLEIGACIVRPASQRPGGSTSSTTTITLASDESRSAKLKRPIEAVTPEFAISARNDDDVSFLSELASPPVSLISVASSKSGMCSTPDFPPSSQPVIPKHRTSTPIPSKGVLVRGSESQGASRSKSKHSESRSSFREQNSGAKKGKKKHRRRREDSESDTEESSDWSEHSEQSVDSLETPVERKKRGTRKVDKVKYAADKALSSSDEVSTQRGRRAERTTTAEVDYITRLLAGNPSLRKQIQDQVEALEKEGSAVKRNMAQDTVEGTNEKGNGSGASDTPAPSSDQHRGPPSGQLSQKQSQTSAGLDRTTAAPSAELDSEAEEGDAVASQLANTTSSQGPIGNDENAPPKLTVDRIPESPQKTRRSKRILQVVKTQLGQTDDTNAGGATRVMSHGGVECMGDANSPTKSPSKKLSRVAAANSDTEVAE